MYELMLCGFSGIIGSFLTLWACRDMVARSAGRPPVDHEWRCETDAILSELREHLDAVREDVQLVSHTVAGMRDEPQPVAVVDHAGIESQVEQLWQAVNDLSHCVRPSESPQELPQAGPVLKVATNGQSEW